MKEPTGLLRTDNKRPDGLTLIPWQRGKPVTWDVTVTSTLADSYLTDTAESAGAAAELAATRKITKYSSLPQTACITFIPADCSGDARPNQLQICSRIFD